MDELAFSDATTLVGKIRAREISSVELLAHYVARMERINPDINAIVVTQLPQARARAAEADAALARGEDWGPLHGLPMTVKESFNLTGLPTTHGFPEYSDNIAPSDAVACERLQAAGAVIFGKTNVPISLADFQSYNDVYGTTNNPHNLAMTPGGSSGGSAAAIAAGLSGLEMGSDIGGSIRNPAHYCGVFGHKSTYGILPMRGHALPGRLTPQDISVIGPLARSAEDLALALQVVGGADDLHQPGWELKLAEPAQKSLKDFRVGVWLDESLATVDETVKERVLQVARLVEAAGGSVDYEARPGFSAEKTHDHYMNLLHAALSARNSAALFEENLKRRAKLASDDRSASAQVTRAATLYHRDWFTHNEQRTKMRWAWHAFFNAFDILLTPTCVTAAFPHDQNPRLSAREITVNNEPQPYFAQLFWAGLTGVSYLPSTIIPTGLDSQGLPIGVQAAGREMGDLMTIEFARLVAREQGGFVPPAAYAN